MKAQSVVHFWANKQIDTIRNDVTFTIYTTGFTTVKAFGCEMYFDSLVFTQDVINKTVLTLHTLSSSGLRLKYKQHSIRFFFLAKKNTPLITAPSGSVLSVTFPIEIPKVHNVYVSLAPWKIGLINELFQPIPVSFTSPIVDVYERNDESIMSSILYPNPSHGLFHLNISRAIIHNMEFSLYDVLGRKVLTSIQPSVATNDRLSFDFYNLSRGTYFFRTRFMDSHGTVRTYVQKLIKIQ